jgi:yeast amino acid transporter
VALLINLISKLMFQDIYIASRTLFGLSKDGLAPKIFQRTNTKGVPIIAIIFSSLFGLLGFMNVSSSSSTVFGYFISLVTVFGTLNWISLLLSYISFRRGMAAQGIPAAELPYRGYLQPYGSYAAPVLVIIITFFNG